MGLQWLVNKEILQKVKADPGYRYEMSYVEYMLLYRHYEAGNTEPANMIEHTSQQENVMYDSNSVDRISATAEILSQDEIDSLVDSLM